MEEVKEQVMAPVEEKPEMVVEERLGLHGVEEEHVNMSMLRG